MLGLALWGAVYYPVDISPNSKLHGGSNTLGLCVMLLKVQMAASFRHSLMGQRQKSNAMLTLTMIKGAWVEYYGGRMTILDHLKICDS